MIKRRKTRTVTVGKVKIGSEYPVSIQSMTKTDTQDVEATVRQINSLGSAGCELVRLAVKSMEQARAISDIKKSVDLPIVADIHFDPELALESMRRGADKIRINPGNMGDESDIDRIIDLASEKNIPMRIGVNSGSLMEMALKASTPAEGMVSSLLKYLEQFQDRGFNDIVISLKSSDVATCIEAYEKMASECDYPFHLGITAAGSPEAGVVASSVGIGALLLKGLGDTVRVSLTGDPVQEVITARNILSSVGMRSFGPKIIACPTCGRCQTDLVSVVEKLESEMKKIQFKDDKELLVAVMGCEVNGPGEAGSADIGIAFGKDKGALFRNGNIIGTVTIEEAVEKLVALIREEMK